MQDCHASRHLMNMHSKFCIFSEPVPESAKVIQQVPLPRNNMTMIITIVSVVCSTLLLVVGIVAIVCCRRWNLRHKKFANVKRVIVMRPVSRRREAILTSFQHDNLISLLPKKKCGKYPSQILESDSRELYEITTKSLFLGILYSGYLMRKSEITE